ncbi:MAG TPA: protein kinase [Myxococcaceae bacterium]|nr:protein kinase [Myxococcaceae bacterium]
MLCPSCQTDAGDVSKYCPSCGEPIVRATQADDIIGKLIAKKFRVESMLGEGGMGKVYKAKQVALDKMVVLKVLRQSLQSDERTVARFQREAKAASRLNHPNSISMLDFGQAEDGSLYIAMELVSGRDLHDILGKEWPLPEARVVRIVSQVLSALQDAHLAGVIHRDLKPENIMVEQRRGEADFVKVLDFGIAKIQDTSEDGPALTRAGFVCGTPEYMSPEQARGAQLDPRSDLYAVGVILYQLTTGMLPFDADSAVGFATKHLMEQPPPPSMRRPEAKISQALEALILRALSKDPAGRPQTADDFRAELFATQGGPARTATGSLRAGLVTPMAAPRSATPTVNDRTAPIRLTREAAATAGERDEAVLREKKSIATVKWVTAALVTVALGMGGFFVWQLMAPSSADAGQPPPPVKVVEAPRSREPYDAVVPAEKRDAAAASRLEREGDMFHRTGQLPESLQKYQEAFAANPSPDLSLKLGELYFQSNQLPQARGWWGRHLRDAQASRARKYILDAMPDLAL